MERLDRRIGQRRDATRAPIQARNGWRPSGRLLVSLPHHLSDGPNLSNLLGFTSQQSIAGAPVVSGIRLHEPLSQEKISLGVDQASGVEFVRENPTQIQTRAAGANVDYCYWR
jgi:hypothetical protein